VKFRLNVSIGLAAAIIIATLACPAVAQMSGRDTSFLDGLRKRGLLRLVETYLDDIEKSGGDPLAIKEQQAVLFEMQGAREPDEQAKSRLFVKAREKYEELIAELRTRIKAESNDRKQDKMRRSILELKVRLGELIWMREPGNHRHVLELSDKQLGDRAKVERLMREATAVFVDIIREATVWNEEMNNDANMERRYLNTGIYDRVSELSRFAKYRTAWTEYYLAYVLVAGKFNVVLADPGNAGSKVVKVLVDQVGMDEDVAAATVGSTPKTVAANLDKDKAAALKAALEAAGAKADIQKEREALLDDAAEKFTEFTKLDDTSKEKWRSMRMLGVCYREKGLHDKAVDVLRTAIEGSQAAHKEAAEDENFKIQTYYELVQTALSARKFPEARAYMGELRSKNFATLPQSFIGSQLMPFLDAKIALAEGRDDPQKKALGLEQMRKLWESGHLVQLVSAEVRKHIKAGDPKSLQPFELWILADDTFLAKDYKKAASYFDEFVNKTDSNNPSHAPALYNLAACYYRMAEAEGLTKDEQLKLMKDAAKRFFEVASKFQKFPSVGRAAESFVLLRSEVHTLEPNEENLEAYATSLGWSLQNRTREAEAANMRWLYGQVLKHQEKFIEAANQYEKVTTDSPNYYQARYYLAECHHKDLVEKKWRDAPSRQLPVLAGKTVDRMQAFATWAKATAARSEPETAKKLREQGAEMLMRAADLLVQEQIAQYERGLRLVRQCETDFADQTELKGAILRIKLAALFAQGRNKEALEILDQLMKSGEDVSDILKQVLANIIQDIQLKIRQNQHDVVRKSILPQADQIAEKFIFFLGSKGQTDKIPLVKFQIAELYREAEAFEGDKGAIKRFLVLITFDPYPEENREKLDKGVEIIYMQGLAECYQKAVAALDDRRRNLIIRNPAKAYKYLQRAAFCWDYVATSWEEVTGVTREERDQGWWNAKFNQMIIYYDIHPLEQKFGKDSEKINYHELIRTFIKTFKATKSEFGGNEMRVKFDRLWQRVDN
jgi:tetratricopeptide (TPR) repeat protein